MSLVSTSAPPTRTCPKCVFESDLATDECPACGIVISKALHAETLAEGVTQVRADEVLPTPLDAAQRLMVKQAVERLEMWTGFETANQYVVKDGMGRVVFDAAEESGSAAQFLGRMFLKAARPFTMHVATSDGRPAYTMKRPFRLLFPEISVFDAQDRLLGSVCKQFSVLNRRYLVHAGQAEASYEVIGPLLRPWTFHIRRHGRDCGVITKKWSGLGKEMFTDADHFGVDFPERADTALKAVLLGAVFLIDFAHFEDNDR